MGSIFCSSGTQDLTHHDFSRGSLLTFIFHYWVGEHQLEIDRVTDATVHEKSPQFNASQKELYKQLFRVDRKKTLAFQTCFSVFAECNLFVSMVMKYLVISV